MSKYIYLQNSSSKKEEKKYNNVQQAAIQKIIKETQARCKLAEEIGVQAYTTSTYKAPEANLKYLQAEINSVESHNKRWEIDKCYEIQRSLKQLDDIKRHSHRSRSPYDSRSSYIHNSKDRKSYSSSHDHRQSSSHDHRQSSSRDHRQSSSRDHRHSQHASSEYYHNSNNHNSSSHSHYTSYSHSSSSSSSAPIQVSNKDIYKEERERMAALKASKMALLNKPVTVSSSSSSPSSSPSPSIRPNRHYEEYIIKPKEDNDIHNKSQDKQIYTNNNQNKCSTKNSVNDIEECLDPKLQPRIDSSSEEEINNKNGSIDKSSSTHKHKHKHYHHRHH